MSKMNKLKPIKFKRRLSLINNNKICLMLKRIKKRKKKKKKIKKIKKKIKRKEKILIP